MRILRLIPLAAIAAAAGCGAPPPRNEQAEAPASRFEPEPPPPLEETVRIAERRDLLPPDAVIGGGMPAGEAETISFDSRNPPAGLVAWYHSSDRDFRIGSEFREGAEYVLSGSTRGADRDFTVRLAPGGTGGTSGMILFTDR